MYHTQRLRLRHFLEHQATPHLASRLHPPVTPADHPPVAGRDAGLEAVAGIEPAQLALQASP